MGLALTLMEEYAKSGTAGTAAVKNLRGTHFPADFICSCIILSNITVLEHAKATGRQPLEIIEETLHSKAPNSPFGNQLAKETFNTDLLAKTEIQWIFQWDSLTGAYVMVADALNFLHELLTDHAAATGVTLSDLLQKHRTSFNADKKAMS